VIVKNHFEKEVDDQLKISLTCCTCWSSVCRWTSAPITGSLIVTSASVSTWTAGTPVSWNAIQFFDLVNFHENLCLPFFSNVVWWKKSRFLESYQLVGDTFLIHYLKLFSSNLKGKSVSKALKKPNPQFYDIALRNVEKALECDCWKVISTNRLMISWRFHSRVAHVDPVYADGQMHR